MTTPHPDRARRSADLASPAERSGHLIGALGALGALALLAAAPLACASPVPPVSAQAPAAAAFPDARTECFGALCVGRPLPLDHTHEARAA